MANDTEQRILEAAMKIFKEKGYEAARTRDIAAEAGLSHALINYHFQNKEKLFNIVMKTTLMNLRQQIVSIINNQETTYREKIDIIISQIHNAMARDSQLVQFFITQIINNKEIFANEFNPREFLFESVFFKQLLDEGLSYEDCFNLHINFISLISMIIIGKPMIMQAKNITEEEYFALLERRAEIIPLWIEKMFNLNKKEK